MSLDQLNRDLEAEVARDRWGRYLIVPTGAAKPVGFVRVTTLSDMLDDRHSLENWFKRQVALGLVIDEQRSDTEHLLDTIRTYPDNKDKIDQACDTAMDLAGANKASKLGSLIHEACAQRDFNLPYLPAYNDYVDTYLRLLDAGEFDVVDGMVEQVVIHEHLTMPDGLPLYVAGTFDRLLRHRPTGIIYVADIKTGGRLSWQSWASQFSAYANADCIYNPVTGQRSPLPEIDKERAVAIHLPANGDTANLYWIDIAAGWEAFQTAIWIRGWRKQKVMKGTAATLMVAPPPVAAPKLTALGPDELDPAIYRPILRDFFQQDRSAEATQLYARWRKEADGLLEFQPTTVHRYERIRAAWMLAVICGEYFDYADSVAAAIIGKPYRVWELSPTLTSELHSLLMDHNPEIRVTFDDGDSEPIYHITYLEKG